jgi:hypothetical protein
MEAGNFAVGCKWSIASERLRGCLIYQQSMNGLNALLFLVVTKLLFGLVSSACQIRQINYFYYYEPKISEPNACTFSLALLLTLYFGSLFIASALLTFRLQLSGKCDAKSAKRYHRQMHLISILKELSLSILLFYIFVNLHYRKSTGALVYYSLLLSSIWYCTSGLLNCALLEHSSGRLDDGRDSSSQKHTAIASLFFLFLFRLFHFAVKWLCLVMSVCTYEQEFAVTPAFSRSINMHVLLAVYLSLSYAFLFAYDSFILNRTRKIKLTSIRWIHEPLKMLVDYNHELIRWPMSIRSSWIKRLPVVFYMLAQLFANGLLVYYWYFRALHAYSRYHSRAALLSLLLLGSESASTDGGELSSILAPAPVPRLALLNLYELDEKIKLRQFLLVTVIGSTLIYLLCHHIYYAYYCEDAPYFMADLQSEHSTKKPHQPPLLSSSQQPFYWQEPSNFDGFSIDTFGQSSSIASSSSLSTSTTLFKRDTVRQPIIIDSGVGGGGGGSSSVEVNFNPSKEHYYSDSQLFSSSLTSSSSMPSQINQLTTTHYLDPNRQEQHCAIYSLSSNSKRPRAFVNSFWLPIARSHCQINESSSGVMTNSSSSLSSIYEQRSYGGLLCSALDASRNEEWAYPSAKAAVWLGEYKGNPYVKSNIGCIRGVDRYHSGLNSFHTYAFI